MPDPLTHHVGPVLPGGCGCFTYGPYDWYVCDQHTVEAASVSKPSANTTIRVPCDCPVGSHSSMGDRDRCVRLRELEAKARRLLEALHETDSYPVAASNAMMRLEEALNDG